MKNLAQLLDLGNIQQQIQQSNGAVNLNQLAAGQGNQTFGTIITAAIPWVFTFAGMLLLVYLIFGGLSLMLSAGDPKKAAGAKQHIGNALIGFLIIFVAYWAVQLVALVLNIQAIKNVFVQ